MSLYPFSTPCPKCGANARQICKTGSTEACDERWIASGAQVVTVEIDQTLRGRPSRITPLMRAELRDENIHRCTAIADRVVPEYRTRKFGRTYSCSGRVAKRWQAAWDGACVALGMDPKDFVS